MRRTAWVVTAAVITAAVVVGGGRIMGADGQENNGRGRGQQCSEVAVRGDYGIQDSRDAAGTRRVDRVGDRSRPSQLRRPREL